MVDEEGIIDDRRVVRTVGLGRKFQQGHGSLLVLRYVVVIMN